MKIDHTVSILVTDTSECLILFVLEFVTEHFVNVTFRKSYSMKSFIE
jgi:hypothetical protein